MLEEIIVGMDQGVSEITNNTRRLEIVQHDMYKPEIVYLASSKKFYPLPPVPPREGFSRLL